MGLKVIYRHVCQTNDFAAVKEWSERIIGHYGWTVSIEFEVESWSKPKMKPVLIIYDTVNKPLEQIKLLIALRWS